LLILGITVTAILIGLIQGSCVEWAFHRFWLHKPLFPKDFFRAHTLVHHQLCKFEDTFHVSHIDQEEAIKFHWWGGPALLGINMTPWIVLAIIFYKTQLFTPGAVFLGSFAATFTIYYLAYEGLHYLMHKPKLSIVENNFYFRFIKDYHRIHHAKTNKNLNVVFPLADILFGTAVWKASSLTPLITPLAAAEIARTNSRYNKFH
jgi:hypothetical protein